MKNINRRIVGNGMYRYVRLRPSISWKMVTDFKIRCKVSNEIDHQSFFVNIRHSIISQLVNKLNG